MNIAGKIIGKSAVVMGVRVPFERVSIAFEVYDEQKLWDTWQYLSHTRERVADKVPDLENAIMTARWLIHRVAYIESAVGQEEVLDWIENGVRRAREIRSERESEAEREALFGKQEGEAS